MNIFVEKPILMLVLVLAALGSVLGPVSAESAAANTIKEVESTNAPSRPDHADRPAVDSIDRPAVGAIELVRQPAKSTKVLDSGAIQIDFGKVAFGNIELTSPADFEGEVVVRFGEKLLDGAIDREPPGSVRYAEVRRTIAPATSTVISPPADARNTRGAATAARNGSVTPPAVLTPSEWGVLVPFRWVEIDAVPTPQSRLEVVRRAAFPKHWRDDSAAFECSNETLNRVWELCRYSIKATMFAGVYVDGDRERIPYEADAYLNQLSHYYTDHDPRMARRTFDWLIQYPTWPTEWGPHMIFMAHADWMRNADADWISRRYQSLKSKTLMERCGKLGLVESNAAQVDWNDIVDWPQCERDGYVRSKVNTVVNAFHLAAVEKMAELATVAGVDEDARLYAEHAARVRPAFHSQLFDPKAGRYRDGLGVNHHSSHASFFPLAFGLAPESDRQAIVASLTEDGMRGSVYAAQYFLEALFENGAGEAAVELMIAPGERSWRTMLDSDATITWEAWNHHVKPNLDWNHAWGAAPANLLPRYVLGAQPIAPGWTRASIRPNRCGLEFARGVAPTPLGAVSVDWEWRDAFTMHLKLPEGMTASVHVPAAPGVTGVLVDGQPVEAELQGDYWVLSEDLAGESTIETR